VARIRSIKPNFARHEKLQELETSHCHLKPMLVFACLWTVCDREGRFEWRPKQLKLDILPFIEFDLSATLELLREHDFVRKYTAGGKVYGYIPTWLDHQCPNIKESASRIPDPPEHHASTVQARADSVNGTEPARGEKIKEVEKEKELNISATPVIVDLKTPEEYEQEQKREKEIIDAAFRHYCIATKRNSATYKLTPYRRKVGMSRLHDCLKLTKGDYDKAAALLCVAIDNLARSDWHMGRDPASRGKVYCDWIDHLFKSYERMEKWWNT